MKPAYCDYIAHLIKKHLADNDRAGNSLLDSVGAIRFDLDPQGAMLSTTKRISIVDIQGKSYTITVEENANGHEV